MFSGRTTVPGFRGWVYRRCPAVRALASERACALDPVRPPETPNAPIVVTVHGTWSPAADWTEDGSDLMSAVSSALAGCGISRFRWSGLNGIGPRLDAADQLRKELSKLNGDSPLVLIGHSHGGNIIAWAVAGLSKEIIGAVYMNTPFIHAKPTAERMVMLGPLVLVMAYSAALTAAYSLSEYLGIPWPPWLLISSSILALLPVNSAWRRLTRTKKRLESASDMPVSEHPELAVFSVGDEVGAYLATQFASQGLIRPVVWASLGGALGLLILNMFLRDSALLMRVVTPIGLLTFGSAFVALSLNTLAYGLEQGIIGLDVPITVTPGPAGNADLFILPWPAVDRREKGNRHSGVYNDPDVIERVKEWIASQLSEAPARKQLSRPPISQVNSRTPGR